MLVGMATSLSETAAVVVVVFPAAVDAGGKLTLRGVVLRGHDKGDDHDDPPPRPHEPAPTTVTGGCVVVERGKTIWPLQMARCVGAAEEAATETNEASSFDQRRREAR